MPQVQRTSLRIWSAVLSLNCQLAYPKKLTHQAARHDFSHFHSSFCHQSSPEQLLHFEVALDAAVGHHKAAASWDCSGCSALVHLQKTNIPSQVSYATVKLLKLQAPGCTAWLRISERRYCNADLHLYLRSIRTCLTCLLEQVS